MLNLILPIASLCKIAIIIPTFSHELNNLRTIGSFTTSIYDLMSLKTASICLRNFSAERII